MEEHCKTPHSRGKGKKVEKYSTDKFALGLYRAILRDFRNTFGPEFLMCHANGTLDLGALRSVKQPSPFGTKPSFFKASNQMANLLKKYVFEHEPIDDRQRTQDTLTKYFTFQRQLTHDMESDQVFHSMTFQVLQRARLIAKKILGPFRADQLVLEARFGTKSSIGCPLHLAYIDHKLTNAAAFTGSSDVTSWWESAVVESDPILQLIYAELQAGLAEGEKLPLNIESLVLKTVPKTYEIDRTITPLALLNLFYSHGYAALVTERLRVAGLDITQLQDIHRGLIKAYSVDLSHVTADASMASESCTSWLLNKVLPRPWFVALKKVMTHQLVLPGGAQAYTESVLPMGNGATFPLETLVFFCLLKALGQLAGVHGTFSVYGDDMIYPSPLHPYVKLLFPRLGIKLNLEKTFVDVNFRESCGSDYYHGVDVRSFYLKGVYRELTKSRYSAEIYKTINGLLERWDAEEIPLAITFCLVELSRLGRKIYRVPPMYPEYSGIRTARPTDILLGYDFLPWAKIEREFVTHDVLFPDLNAERGLIPGCLNHRFEHLAEANTKRVLPLTSKAESPWYWLALSSSERQERRIRIVGHLSGRLNYILRKLRLPTDASPYTDATEVRSWGWFTKITSFWKDGKRVAKSKNVRRPYCPERGRTTVRKDVGSVTDWT